MNSAMVMFAVVMLNLPAGPSTGNPLVLSNVTEPLAVGWVALHTAMVWG